MKKLVAYITASYPDTSFTVDLAYNMKEAGVDILELGIPFSDPIADGPIIEKANLLALKKVFNLEDLFEVSSKVGSIMDTLWMGYLNPFYHYGVENFFKKAKEFNIIGEIIPDLPYEEALLYEDLAKKYNQAIITFVAPTHSKQRIKKVVKDAQKFIYLVSYMGITGSGKSDDLREIIQTVKENTSVPLYVGFGVDEKSCKEKSKGVDGVIVGSAFVKHIIDDTLSYNKKITNIIQIAKEIKEKINE